MSGLLVKHETTTKNYSVVIPKTLFFLLKTSAMRWRKKVAFFSSNNE